MRAWRARRRATIRWWRRGRAQTARALALGRLGRQGYASADAIARAQAEAPLDRRGRAGFLAPHFTTRLARPTGNLPAERGLAHVARSRRSRRRSRRKCGTQPRRCVTGAPGTRRWSCSTTRPARSSRGSARPTSGPIRRARWTWSSRPVSRAPRSSHSSTGSRSTAGTPRRACCPTSPRVYQTSTGPYAPRNYDRRFHGPVRAREALASSFNLPAVELAGRLGAGQSALDPPAGRLRLARPQRRVLRARPRARQRRRDAARAGQRLPRARERRALAPGALATDGAGRAGRTRAAGGQRTFGRAGARHPRAIRSPAFPASDSTRRSIFPFRPPPRPAPAATSPTTGRSPSPARFTVAVWVGQLQRPADGRRERRERRRPAAAPRRCSPPPIAIRPARCLHRGRPARCRRESAACRVCWRPTAVLR